MASVKSITVSLGAALVLAVPAAYADLGSGTYHYAFSNVVSIWDISGSYNEEMGPVDVNYTINMDGAGKMSGTGDFTYTGDYGDYLSGDMTVSGAIKNAAGVTRVGFTTKVAGDGYIQGYYVTFTAQMKENLELDRPSGELIGTASGKLTVAVPELHKKQSAPIPLAENHVSLPAGVDGNWNLSLTVITNQTKYAGTATIVLCNDRTLDLSLSGSYSAKTDLSKVALKNVPPGPSMKLNLVTSFDQLGMAIQSLKGKVLGQTISSQ